MLASQSYEAFLSKIVVNVTKGLFLVQMKSKTEKQLKREKAFPQRKFAVKA